MRQKKAKLRLLLSLLAFVTIAGVLILWAIGSSPNDSVARARARLRLSQEELTVSEKFVQKFEQSNSPAFRALGDKLVAAARKQNTIAQIRLALAERGEHLDAVATNFVENFQDFDAAQEAMAKLDLANIGDIIVKPNRPPDHTQEQYRIYAASNSATALSALESTQISRVITSNEPFVAIHAWETLQTNGIRSSMHPMKWRAQTSRPDEFVVFVNRSDESKARAMLRN
jgi:hypothetical protein